MTTETIQTRLRGKFLLADPYLNKGSAFPADERDAFGLRGLLPLHCSTLEEQLVRTYENFQSKQTAIEKYIFLAALQDRNEVLFYKLVQTHITEMVPILYTPTVGEACQRYSHLFRRARGVYLSAADQKPALSILRDAAPDDIDVIVVTDGERILGLGDLGVGGMGIPVGKLTLYTLGAGVDPRRTLPILLDVGTNNKDLLNDPLYLGWKHPRLEREEYDRFVDSFVEAVRQRWPKAILQWEDFSKNNAWRLLERHKAKLPTFNDDIQGTAAVTVAGLLRAFKVQKQALKTQRIVIAGAGWATGIGALLRLAMKDEGATEAEIRNAIWLIDTQGLVHQGRSELSDEKTPYAQSVDHLKSKGLDPKGSLTLEAVVSAVHPTVLIGTSGQPGVFHEALIRSMAASVDRPIIFPLSNPTSKSEAIPKDIMAWTEGRAIVATGSPFPAVEWKGKKIPIGQCNNAFIFPGLGLGLVAAHARTVPNELFLTAARALAAFDDRLPGFEESLFPNLEHVRKVSALIAVAVAKEVARKGLSWTPLKEDQMPELVQKAVWNPIYPTLKPLS